MRAPAATALPLALALAGSVSAQASWRWTPLQGEAVEGVVLGLTGDGMALRMRVGDGSEQGVPLVALDRGVPVAGVEPVAPGGEPVAGWVWLRNGSRWPWSELAPGPAAGAGIALRPFGFATAFPIPLNQLAAIAREPAPAGFAEALASPEPERDLLFAEGSKGSVQRLGVELLRAGPEGLVVGFRGRERPPLAWSRIEGLVRRAGSFTPGSGGDGEGAPTVQVESEAPPKVALDLPGGGLLLGRIVAWGDGELSLDLGDGLLVPVPEGRVSGIAVRSPLRTWLSDLVPQRVEQQPALDRVWPWLVDRAPGGPGIRLGSNRWQRGLVVVPRTRLEFTVGGQGYTVFRAVLGIDERAGPAGHAVMRILGDGRLLHSTGPITAASLPQRVELDIRGVEVLALEADFGDRLDFGDHCAFAGAVLLRTPQSR